MTPSLPPLDLHAHLRSTIAAGDLERLGAVVFAATRSLDEFESTRGRRDAVTVWGIGCHPGVVAAQQNFDRGRFATLARTTPFVSEVGLDRRSRIPMATQEATFRAILQELALLPRIVSIHSSGAPDRVLDALADASLQGAVLHWWRGTPAQTARAVALGCWFSVNAAGTEYPIDIARMPLDRILTETDHPAGDRTSPPPHQPGAVKSVEEALAAIYGVAAEGMRAQVWQNFKRLVSQTEVEPLLPSPVRRMVNAA